MKLIKDEELLEMLRQGKSQKDAAEHFGVSAVAVCRRLKRLLPQPTEVLEKYDLTEQQKAFIIQKAKGKTNTEAVLASYEVSTRESAKVLGSQLMDNPSVKMALKELVELHIPQNHRLGKLRGHVDHVDPVVSLKALDLSWKLDGSYDENREPPPVTQINVIVHHQDGRTVVLEGLNRLQDEKYREAIEATASGSQPPAPPLLGGSA